MDRLTKKILSFIRENRLIVRGDQIAAGLSGGADSVSLIIILNNIKKLLGFNLCAIHINHGLRGCEADRDEAFCRDLCARLGVRFAAERVDVRGLVREAGLSEEEAARLLRYEALHRLAEHMFVSSTSGAEDRQNVKIAVAHHADDQAETILFNMLRGSGMRGLGGMRPMRDDIIRPLLCVGRDEILRYLDDLGQDYVTDSTNLLNDHTRNVIRNVVMPELKENVNKRSAEHITELGNRIYEADEYMRNEAAAFLDTCSEVKEVKIYGKPERRTEGQLERQTEGRPERKEEICIAHLKEKPQVFRIYVIIEALRRLDIPLKDWGERHFKDIDRLLFLGKGAHADLPAGVKADRDKGYLTIKVLPAP